MKFTHGPKRDPKDFPFKPEMKRQPHFLRLHDKHLHTTADGEEFHAIHHEVAIKHLVANLDDAAGFDAIACALGSSGCTIFENLIRAGERDPEKIFEMTQDGHILVDEHGVSHLRLRYDFAYCHSRDHQRDMDISEAQNGVNGGKHSVRQMEVIKALLEDIGIEVNHERVKAETCKNCNK